MLKPLRSSALNTHGTSTPPHPSLLEIPVSNENVLPAPPGTLTALRGPQSSPCRGSDSQVPLMRPPFPYKCPEPALDLSFLPVSTTLQLLQPGSRPSSPEKQPLQRPLGCLFPKSEPPPPLCSLASAVWTFSSPSASPDHSGFGWLFFLLLPVDVESPLQDPGLRPLLCFQRTCPFHV